jgi:hypothetical protein
MEKPFMDLLQQLSQVLLQSAVSQHRRLQDLRRSLSYKSHLCMLLRVLLQRQSMLQNVLRWQTYRGFSLKKLAAVGMPMRPRLLRCSVSLRSLDLLPKCNQGVLDELEH